jgi:hypothetical protein
LRNRGAPLDFFASYIMVFVYSAYINRGEDTPVELTALADMEVVVFRA